MTTKGKLGAVLLLSACTVLLLWGPESGINGVTVLGTLTAVVGLGLMARDID